MNVLVDGNYNVYGITIANGALKTNLQQLAAPQGLGNPRELADVEKPWRPVLKMICKWWVFHIYDRSKSSLV